MAGIEVQRHGESLARTVVNIGTIDEDEFRRLRKADGLHAALLESQEGIHILLAGCVAEHAWREEPFDLRRFRRDTCWDSEGQPFTDEQLQGRLKHNDRDKAHLLAVRILRFRPSVSASVEDHLVASWQQTHAMVRDAFPVIDRVARAVLENDGLSEGELQALFDEVDRERWDEGVEEWTRDGGNSRRQLASGTLPA